MNKLTILTMIASAVLLSGCRTARITETTTTTTVIKDTTARVEVPKDSARVDFTLSVVADSVKAPTVADTTIEVKSDLSMAVFTVRNGKASLKVVDGKGKKDSIEVKVKGGVRETNRSHEKLSVVEKKPWTAFVPTGLLILVIVYLVFYFLPRRR